MHYPPNSPHKCTPTPTPEYPPHRIFCHYHPSPFAVLMDEDFLPSLRKYDKDHIDPGIIKKIQTYVSNPEFLPEKIQQVRHCSCLGGAA